MPVAAVVVPAMVVAVVVMTVAIFSRMMNGIMDHSVGNEAATRGSQQGGT